jgi:beta-N-acetylhexosaminidase
VVQILRLLLPAAALFLFASYQTLAPARAGGALSPPPPAAVSPENWVDSVMRTMTLEEKAGQVIGVLGKGHYLSEESDEFLRLVQLVTGNHVGCLVLPQSDVYSTAMLINRLQREARIPLLLAADLERGPAMRVRRATYFPDAMAIGATRNPDYSYRIARAIAVEARALGVRQIYAPVADVNTNPVNPVINTRSFGDDVGLVNSMVSAFVRGVQEEGCIATAKHFPGHGDTGTDSHLDLPGVYLSRSRLDSVELAPFRTAIASGVRSVMVGHLAVPALESTPRLPASLSKNITTTLLKENMGFNGLVVTDAMEMQGVVRGYSVAQSTVMAFEAGADIVLLPPDDDISLRAIIAAVRSGEIPERRLDLSVRKILEAKQWAGLDRERFASIAGISRSVATRSHVSLARNAARDAITVLKNSQDLIPLEPGEGKEYFTVVLTDGEDARTEVNRPTSPLPNEAAGAYFLQLVGRRAGRMESVHLHAASNALAVEEALKRAKAADVVLLPIYMKVRTSSGRIALPDRLKSFLAELEKLGRPTVAIIFGNPYIAGNLTGFHSIVCAYSDAEVLVESSVEVLFGTIAVRGKLPARIPGAFAYGAGMDLIKTRLRPDDPSAAGFDPVRLRAIDGIIEQAIGDSAFPAAQVAIVRDGLLVWNRSYGTYAYDLKAREISNATLFDLASVSKVIGTTSSVMLLADRGKIGLDDPVSKYIPQFADPPKSQITIRHLLLHRGGLPPFRKLWEFCRSANEALDSVFATPLIAPPGDTTIYSDLGFITLGKVVEKVSGMSLDAFSDKEFFGPLGMRNTLYRPPSRVWTRIAPTEFDSTWRGRLVRGTVHDENAAFLGGVSGHAGLFSTASDLAVFMQMIMSGGTYGGRRYLSDSIIHLFTGVRGPGQDRYLGWDARAAKGSSSGSLFSTASFGHTGFTGTSIWVDPERKVAVIFLTNRVNPTRANGKIAGVRPRLHDAIISALGQGGEVSP